MILAATLSEERFALAVVIAQLALVYLTALLGGECCRRLRIPSLLGELLGGILIGVSGLRWIVLPVATQDSSVLVNWVGWLHGTSEPEVIRQVFQFQGDFFQSLAAVGITVLLFEIGLGSTLNQLLLNRSQAIAVAGVGVLLSMLGGTLGLNAFWQVPLVPALFMGAALSATSLGITVQLLRQQGRYADAETQVILGAALLDDVAGVILLSLILGFAREGEFSSLAILRLLTVITVAIAIAIIFGRSLGPALLSLQNQLTTRGRVIVPAVMLMFLFVVLATTAQLAGIFGAFMAGLVVQGSSKRHIAESLRPVVDAFVPIFFVYVGAGTNLRLLGQSPQSGVLVVFLVLVAIAAKLASGYAVSRHEGVNPLVVGLGMIPRGEVGLVFAELGRSTGILSPQLGLALVLVSIATTLVTSLGFRFLPKLPYCDLSSRAVMRN